MKICLIVGARPNFVKAAALITAAKIYPELEIFLLHTGQHYDPVLSENIFKDLEIPKPNINLGVHGGSLSEQTAKVISGCAEVFRTNKFDVFMACGDTVAGLAGSIAAKQAGLKLVHVESGLRCGDRTMPEEMNRVIIDHMSDLLFVTEAIGIDNLKNEGITKNVFLTGNVMIDVLVANWKKITELKNVADFKKYGILTLHRPFNVDTKDQLKKLLDIFGRIGIDFMPLIFPVHPRTRQRIEEFGLSTPPGIHMVEPLSYSEFHRAMYGAMAIFTDSGGIQEEASWMNIPCLTLRPNTERPGTVEDGTNTVIGDDYALLRKLIKDIVEGKYKQAKQTERGDGKAAERILEIIVKTFV
jgi:UDP-N-acetylglucosamine 2-epimerase (non-hydrolysing)